MKALRMYYLTGYGLQISVANDTTHYIVRHSDVDMGVGVT